MATLQKFKLLASRCGAAPTQSPTRSPRTSPMVQLRRRKTTLRMLLSSRSPRRRDPPIQLKHLLNSSQKKTKKKKKKGEDFTERHSLKELFVSSPPEEESKKEIPMREMDSVRNVALGGSVIWSNEPGSPKPVWRVFRFRSLLKKSRRPALESISE
ncbi:uncharacterized protein G2W53_018936 [Senna tora]|uniref:Uncharacterized protein n=1 Tax=Senna tora TaxID=362788 RepID=A0A834TUI2_9FABA|nr:uncharacterized protein G2W53_018936 [Senna tora]